MKCITVLYPAKDNDAFDFEFYLRRHVALIQDILGKSLHRIEVRKGATAQDGSSAPTFTSVISIWIADWPAYEKAMAAVPCPGRQQGVTHEVHHRALSREGQ